MFREARGQAQTRNLPEYGTSHRCQDAQRKNYINKIGTDGRNLLHMKDERLFAPF